MKNEMTLNTFDADFSTTSVAKAFAAAIVARVLGAQEAGISLSSDVSASAQRKHGRAA